MKNVFSSAGNTICILVYSTDIIVRLSEDSLAKRMWKEQKLYGWPGLAEECDMIVKELGIEDINTT